MGSMVFEIAGGVQPTPHGKRCGRKGLRNITSCFVESSFSIVHSYFTSRAEPRQFFLILSDVSAVDMEWVAVVKSWCSV